MKPHIKNRSLLPVLMAGLGLTLVGPVTAQTFRALHSFSRPDGAGPFGGLTLSGDTLYGMTGSGGGSGGGALFAIKTDGTGFTNLYNFPSTGGYSILLAGGLTLASNTLYGTTYDYYARDGYPYSGNGTVFKLNTDGSGFTTLYNFTALIPNNLDGTNTDGVGPMGGLALAGDSLYGTTEFGGPADFGTVFKVNTDGTGFTTLHGFYDAAYASGSLVLSEGTLYGEGGYGEGAGSVFKINTDGSGFVVLHDFGLVDGDSPQSGLTLSGSVLYGVSQLGGSWDNGVVFKINTDGTDFAILHTFSAYSRLGTNSDGAGPVGRLTLSGDTLLGMTSFGGNAGNGTVFKVNTDGTGFAILYNFSPFSGYVFGSVYDLGTNKDGAYPDAALTLNGNTVYGTTFHGGNFGVGGLFSISFSPPLAAAGSESNIILSWPTSYAGFDYTRYTLQSTTNLLSPVWITNAPAPVVVNGQNTVTNPISGTQQFFRLSQ